MLRNYYINKEWIVSATARNVYRAAARLSLAFLVMLIGLRFVGEIPAAILPMMKLFLLAGVFSTATTMVAMEYFLFGFDTSSSVKKAFWFLFMLFPLLGPPLYCFFVYSRSDVVKASSTERTTSVSA
jgi:hypothetical protein